MSAGKTRPDDADKGVDAQPVNPFAQGLRSEGIEQRRDAILTCAVAGAECGGRFGVRDVHAALAGHQELAADRGHGIEKIDVNAGRQARTADHFGRHQTGRPAADDGYTFPVRHESLRRSSGAPKRPAVWPAGADRVREAPLADARVARWRAGSTRPWPSAQAPARRTHWRATASATSTSVARPATIGASTGARKA